MADFQALQRAAWMHAEAKGFHDAQRKMTPGEAGTWIRLMLIVTEVAEAAETLRTTNPLKHWVEPKRASNGTFLLEVNLEDMLVAVQRGNKPIGFLSEIADVVIRCMDLCEEIDLDLGLMIEAKQAYNLTRAHLHGKKV